MRRSGCRFESAFQFGVFDHRCHGMVAYVFFQRAHQTLVPGEIASYT